MPKVGALRFSYNFTAPPSTERRCNGRRRCRPEKGRRTEGSQGHPAHQPKGARMTEPFELTGAEPEPQTPMPMEVLLREMFGESGEYNDGDHCGRYWWELGAGRLVLTYEPDVECPAEHGRTVVTLGVIDDGQDTCTDVNPRGRR